MARNALKPILGEDQVGEIERQVEAGKLSLDDLNSLADKGKDISTGVLTLIFESTDANKLDFPDNVVIVPGTGHIFLQEDSDGDQFVRGVTPSGEIYDFAKNGPNGTEFCGGCFDPRGNAFYLNQQGERGDTPEGPGADRAVTYAIYGPFGKAANR